MSAESSSPRSLYALDWTQRFIAASDYRVRLAGHPKQFYSTKGSPAQTASDLLVPLILREEPLRWNVNVEPETAERCRAIGATTLTLLSFPGQSKNPEFRAFASDLNRHAIPHRFATNDASWGRHLDVRTMLNLAGTMAAHAFLECSRQDSVPLVEKVPHDPFEQQPPTILECALKSSTLREAIDLLVKERYLSPYDQQGLLFVIGYESIAATQHPDIAARVELQTRHNFREKVGAAVSHNHPMETLKHILGYPPDSISGCTISEYLSQFRKKHPELSPEESSMEVRKRIIEELVYAQTREYERSRQPSTNPKSYTHSSKKGKGRS